MAWEGRRIMLSYMAGRSYPLSLFISGLCVLISTASLIFLCHVLGSLFSTFTSSSTISCLLYLYMFPHCCCWFPLARVFPCSYCSRGFFLFPLCTFQSRFVQDEQEMLYITPHFQWILLLSSWCTRKDFRVLKGFWRVPFLCCWNIGKSYQHPVSSTVKHNVL